jgi:hypothetical protein
MDRPDRYTVRAVQQMAVTMRRLMPGLEREIAAARMTPPEADLGKVVLRSSTPWPPHSLATPAR